MTWPRAELSGSVPTKGRRFALVMSGGAEVPLGRGELIIGRSRSSQIVVDDMLISRHHARLLVSRSALFVEDLGSTNGVIVNESPIAGPTPLRDGDRLIVGSHEMQVRGMDEALPSTEPPPPQRATDRPTPVQQQSVKIAAVSIQGLQRTIPMHPVVKSVPAAGFAAPGLRRRRHDSAYGEAGWPAHHGAHGRSHDRPRPSRCRFTPPRPII